MISVIHMCVLYQYFLKSQEHIWETNEKGGKEEERRRKGGEKNRRKIYLMVLKIKSKEKYYETMTLRHILNLHGIHP